VYVGGLYIGAVIERSAFHARREAARSAGAPVRDLPTVDPAHLADLPWTMHRTRSPTDATYPADLFGHGGRTESDRAARRDKRAELTYVPLRAPSWPRGAHAPSPTSAARRIHCPRRTTEAFESVASAPSTASS
jgi:hypothetical protein